MKIFFDRFTDIVTHHKHLGRQFQGKTALLLAFSADKELPEGFEVPFKRTCQYLKMNYEGCIYQSDKFEKDQELKEKIKSFVLKLK
jgi:hypothetical protein